jgi:hypothetical protein
VGRTSRVSLLGERGAGIGFMPHNAYPFLLTCNRLWNLRIDEGKPFSSSNGAERLIRTDHLMNKSLLT